MAFGDKFIEVERVKQPALIARLPPHHYQTPSPTSPGNGITAQPSSRAFFNTIDPERTWRHGLLGPILPEQAQKSHSTVACSYCTAVQFM
jgi:hypothetical protein